MSASGPSGLLVSFPVSSPKATPETQNVINVISQLEKDEEVARKLQVDY